MMPQETSMMYKPSRHDGRSSPRHRETSSVATGVLALSICTKATDTNRYAALPKDSDAAKKRPTGTKRAQ
eukprot:scaffold104897_cov72-Phaeocystis_antarctica.AAC.3